LTSLESAAEVVKAIDDRDIQMRRDWDLSGWQYELIPWGVRFRCERPKYSGHADIRAVLQKSRRDGDSRTTDLQEFERSASFVETIE